MTNKDTYDLLIGNFQYLSDLYFVQYTVSV